MQWSKSNWLWRKKKIIDYEEKDMIPLTDSENKFYKKQEKRNICQKEFCYDKNEKKK